MGLKVSEAVCDVGAFQQTGSEVRARCACGTETLTNCEAKRMN